MRKFLSKEISGLELEFQLGSYLIDIAHPETKTAIEVDGVYWHSLPGRLESDKRKDRFLRRNGWKVTRITDENLKSWIKKVPLAA